MVVGKVIGEIVSSVKIDRLIGQKFLLIEVQNITNDPKGSKILPTGTTLIVNDPIGAGRGELVLVVQGSSARMTDTTASIPTDGLIIGIVDSVSVDTNFVYRKGEKE
ncbi:MAG: EutN/CcmL family microcompartment protein [Candidatus Latescibacteria bacterium]|nr:EutN/CcmL family microcompartment protein [Candidatus Latescibacterota bacterium]